MPALLVDISNRVRLIAFTFAAVWAVTVATLGQRAIL